MKIKILRTNGIRQITPLQTTVKWKYEKDQKDDVGNYTLANLTFFPAKMWSNLMETLKILEYASAHVKERFIGSSQ